MEIEEKEHEEQKEYAERAAEKQRAILRQRMKKGSLRDRRGWLERKAQFSEQAVKILKKRTKWEIYVIGPYVC